MHNYKITSIFVPLLTKHTELAMENEISTEKQEEVNMQKALLANLPEGIELKGVGLTRVVFLDGKELSLEKSRQAHPLAPTYDWGYTGRGPMQLAAAILGEFVHPTIASTYMTPFMHYFVQHVKEPNFKVELKVRALFKELIKKGSLKNEELDAFFIVQALELEDVKK